MRYLMFGGSFNPIHIGHLVALEDAMHEFGYDAAILVPASRPPHKAEIERDPGAEARLELVRIACADNRALLVEDLELRRAGPSYSIDTVRELIARYAPEGKPGLLIGDDLVGGFDKWKEPTELVSIADVIVARRSIDGILRFPYPHRACSNPLLPISSTDIRTRIREGKPYRYLLSPEVCQIIIARGYYA